MPLLDPQLKEILICPHCHGELEELEARSLLRCLGCGLGFGVADGFPNMLIDEAEQPEGFSMQAPDASAFDDANDSATPGDASDNLQAGAA